MKTICALTAGLLVAGLAVAAEPIPDGLGVNIHFTEAKPGEMEMIRDAGIGIIRMDMTWAGIEKQQGVYDFSRYDILAKSLEANGVRGLFILDYGNPLYDGGLSPHTDEGRAAFARFAAAAVQRYAGKGILWEIWNEPNHPQFWKPKVNVDDYAKLALTAIKAMRAAAPGEKIIGPATSTIDLPFLESCFKAGLLEHFDAVSVHPYRGSAPETVTDEYRKLRRLMARYAPEGKQIPVLSGEWGYSTARPEIDPARQAQYLVRQWLVNLSADIPVSIWYDWRDDGRDAKEVEHNFGTVRNGYRGGENPPYQPKPAYVAAQTLTRELKGYRFNKRLMLERENDWLLVFVNGESVKLVAWTTDAQPHRAKLPVREGAFLLTAHTGENRGEVVAGDGALEVDLSDGPTYITPRGENARLKLLANWSRLEDVVAFHAPGQLETRTTLQNTTPNTLAAYLGSGQDSVLIPVAPGKPLSLPQTWYIPRTPYFIRVESRLVLDGPSLPLLQQAYVGAVNPLQVEVRPAERGQIDLVIDNPAGEATSSQVSIGVGVAQPLLFATGENQKTLKFPVPDTRDPYTVHVVIKSNDQLLLELPARRYVPISVEPLSVIDDGDQAVKSEVHLATAAADDNAHAPALQLKYQFDEGWKFARIAPPSPIPLDGRPLALGVWVRGDGSGNLLRLRFIDSTEQVFQPNGFALHFSDWRYLEFPLRGEAASHWAGANDGLVHYPIRLDTLLLVDSAQRKATAGEIQFRGTVLISAEE